jgi:hypothetical protein
MLRLKSILNLTTTALAVLCLLFCLCVVASAQKKKKKSKPPEPAPVTELSELRDQYVKATNDYKASLEKLLLIYQVNVKRSEEKLATSKNLLNEGLLSKSDFERNEQALKAEQDKVADVQKQMATADSQIAAVLVEADADATLAKNLKLARTKLVRTTSFMRFNGTPGWGLGDAWKVQRFFSDTFHKSLPVAVFGQGAIHDRWRLDHRNAMDISLHPDSAEGQALLNFLQKNGIPFLAFRSAIPGTATGPHIHIGRPSHRY